VQFTKRLHAGIEAGTIICTVRIWKRPLAKVCGHYRVGRGPVEVDSIHRIMLDDITPELARRSGFDGVVGLLKVAKHGTGEQVNLIEFSLR